MDYFGKNNLHYCLSLVIESSSNEEVAALYNALNSFSLSVELFAPSFLLLERGEVDPQADVALSHILHNSPDIVITTATISLSSDIMQTYGGYSKTMTLTQGGTITDIDMTTGLQRRKLTSTTATDLVIMADASLIVETRDSSVVMSISVSVPP